MNCALTAAVSCCRRECVVAFIENKLHDFPWGGKLCSVVLRAVSGSSSDGSRGRSTHIWKCAIYLNKLSSSMSCGLGHVWCCVCEHANSARSSTPIAYSIYMLLFVYIQSKQKRQYCVCTSLDILTSVRPVESILWYRLTQLLVLLVATKLFLFSFNKSLVATSKAVEIFR